MRSEAEMKRLILSFARGDGHRKAGRLLLGCLVLLSLSWAGCSTPKCEISVEDPIRIGQGDAVLANGEGVKIMLEMVRGTYFQADASVSPYQTNFKGEYQFRVQSDSDDKVLSKGEMAPFEDTPLCFDEMFHILPEDYNSDGNPDFTIGQYGGGNYNIYGNTAQFTPGGLTRALLAKISSYFTKILGNPLRIPCVFCLV